MESKEDALTSTSTDMLTYGNAYTMHSLSHTHAHTQTQTYTAQKNLDMLGYVKRFSQNINWSHEGDNPHEDSRK